MVWERATLTTITEPQILNDSRNAFASVMELDNGEDYPDRPRRVAAPVQCQKRTDRGTTVVGTRLQNQREENLGLFGR